MNVVEHPFILDLRGVAQDKRILYMFIDFMPNGDLMKVITHFTKLESKLAKFYFAQIVMCLEYLHSKNMVYRDLKPENVLVQSNGYLKMADFGFIKQLEGSSRTYTFCGTPEYIAPEIILNKGYSHPVDWYASGIVLYEMLYGRPPFMHNDPYELFQMTLKNKLKFPRDMDKDAKSLIKKLCKHDLSRRYGNLANGAKDIKNHRFFKTINWLDLGWCKVEPPYVPTKDTKQEDSKEIKTYEHLPEANDNANFPPIKATKDDFINIF